MSSAGHLHCCALSNPFLWIFGLEGNTLEHGRGVRNSAKSTKVPFSAVVFTFNPASLCDFTRSCFHFIFQPAEVFFRPQLWLLASEECDPLWESKMAESGHQEWGRGGERLVLLWLGSVLCFAAQENVGPSEIIPFQLDSIAASLIGLCSKTSHHLSS